MKKIVYAVISLLILSLFLSCDADSIRRMGRAGDNLSGNLIGYKPDMSKEEALFDENARQVIVKLQTSGIPSDFPEFEALVDSLMVFDHLDISDVVIQQLGYDSEKIKSYLDVIIGDSDKEGSVLNIINQVLSGPYARFGNFPEIRNTIAEIKEAVEKTEKKKAEDITLEDIILVVTSEVVNEEFSSLIDKPSGEIIREAYGFSQYIDVLTTIGVIEELDINTMVERYYILREAG